MFFVLCFAALSASAGHAFEAGVKYVIDGDTFVLDDGRRVRIASIDTPEIGYDGKKDQFYARESKDMLMKLIKGKIVSIDYTRDRKDKYKRIVGWVHVNGMLVNEYLVRNGYAFYYHHSGNGKKYQNILLQAQRKAYNEKKGFWPALFRADGFSGIWVGNRKSRRCFPEGDRYAARISWRNRVIFSSLGEAFEKGYSPARHVDFWPLVK